MASLDTPKLLVPVDVSTDSLPGDELADFLAGIDVVLLGYFPVPDQSLPAQLKLNRGEEAIDWIADRADLTPDEYDSEVVVSDDTEAAIVDAVMKYDTVCVGLSEKSETERVLFGSIAERISRSAPGNVGIIRGKLGRIVDEPGDESAPAAD